MDDSSGTGAPPAAERDPRASTENGPIPPSVTLRDGNAAPLAGFPERFLARFSDYANTAAFLVAAVLVVVVIVIIATLAGADWCLMCTNGVTPQMRVGLLLSLLVLAAAAPVALFYEPVATARSGQTLGKSNQQIKVVHYNDGLVATASRRWIRWAVPIAGAALGWVIAAKASLPMPYLGMPALWLLVYASTVWDKDRRGWHDRIAGTVVVDAAWQPPPSEPKASARREADGSQSGTQGSYGLVSDYSAQLPRRPH